MSQIAEALRALPLTARRSVTFDRGSEFVDWPHLQAEPGARTWFCDPQSPWQKGSIENANKRLGRWISRDTDPGTFTQDDLRILCAGLNATPRKSLSYRTPAEVFRANVIGHGYRNVKLSRQPKARLG
jgi:IS30 family transposase